MACYSIYIPRGSGPPAAILERVGLADLLVPGDSLPLVHDIVDRGPDGGSGVILTWGGPGAPRLGHHPEYQVWDPAPPAGSLPGGRYWYGFEPANPPRPCDLLRTEQCRLPGFDLSLADGNLWTMPNAIRLPHRFVLDPAGEEIREVKADFLEVYTRAMEIFELIGAHLRATDPDPLPGPRIRDYLAWMLGRNYRVNRDLCYRLKLWDDQNWFGAAEATVDFLALARIEDDVKKKGGQRIPAGSTPGDGGADSPPSNTNPHFST
jgi:hypothetical protein